MERYIGHESQICGVEEHKLVGGKGDGMRLFQVKNGKGLEFTVSADKCADLSRVSFKGVNLGFFSPVGYVAPQYFVDKDLEFLKSFTAGFLTTCGLTNAGNASYDHGLHGTISNTPADQIHYENNEEDIRIYAKMNDACIFTHKLVLEREIVCSKTENKITINDTVKNIGTTKSPLMVLYHINLGYPLIDEDSILEIPSKSVTPRNEHSAKDLDKWNKMQKPTDEFLEQCYYHELEDQGKVKIYNPNINKGVNISFDTDKLDHLIQWKMMGVRDYVLGIEPANCHVDGRKLMENDGTLKYLKPLEEITFTVEFEIIEK